MGRLNRHAIEDILADEPDDEEAAIHLAERDLVTAIRNALSAYRWQGPSAIAETLRRAKVETDAEEVEIRLLDMPHVVRDSAGRFRRA